MKIFTLYPWLCLSALIASGCSGKSNEATIKAQGGYEVRITADTSWEYQRSFFCELWLNGKQLKGPRFFDVSEGVEYKLVEARDNAGFKIMDASTQRVLILVNRKTGDSWPWAGDQEMPQETDERKSRLESLFKDAEAGAF